MMTNNDNVESSLLTSNLLKICSLYKSGADPGFDQGGAPDRDRLKLLTVRSNIVRAKRALFSMGSWVFHY